jgi:hypothetical protein
MSNPNDVFTVALSRSQINEILAHTNVVNPPPGLQEGRNVLRRAVREPTAVNDPEPVKQRA